MGQYRMEGQNLNSITLIVESTDPEVTAMQRMGGTWGSSNLPSRIVIPSFTALMTSMNV